MRANSPPPGPPPLPTTWDWRARYRYYSDLPGWRPSRAQLTVLAIAVLGVALTIPLVASPH